MIHLPYSVDPADRFVRFGVIGRHAGRHDDDSSGYITSEVEPASGSTTLCASQPGIGTG